MKKEKRSLCLAKVNTFVKKNSLNVFAVALGLLTLVEPAFAANEAKNLMEMIIKILGALSIIAGAIIGFTGLMAYAEAKSEGEGPAMAKAKNQLTSAVMLVLLGGSAAALASKFASLITSITL